MSQATRTLIDTAMTLGLQSVSDDWKAMRTIAKLLQEMPPKRRQRAMVFLNDWLTELEATEATPPPSDAPRLT